jgi:hypothetical protein
MTKTPHPIQLQKHLSNVDYPASRGDLLEAAREHGADQNVIKALEAIPDREYDGPIAVSRAISGES